MKTIKKSVQKYLRILVLSTGLVLIGCVAQIPNIDTEDPTFHFRITGDGFNREFDQDTDFDSFQLNLREGAEYDFIFRGADNGGVKQIQWQFNTNYVDLETTIANPWIVNIEGLSNFVNWFGDSADPITGMVLGGTFRARGNLESHRLIFMVKDFGGVSSTENTIFRRLNILPGDHNTEIVDL